MAAELRLEDFDGRIGETFEVGLDEASVPIRLTEAKPLRYGVREAGFFRLEWRGEPGRLLEQGTYPIRLPGGAVHDIFIVPIACDEEGARYEAIFN